MGKILGTEPRVVEIIQALGIENDDKKLDMILELMKIGGFRIGSRKPIESNFERVVEMLNSKVTTTRVDVESRDGRTYQRIVCVKRD